MILKQKNDEKKDIGRTIIFLFIGSFFIVYKV